MAAATTPTHTDVWIVEDDADYRDRIASVLSETGSFRCTAALPDTEALNGLLSGGGLWEEPNVVLMDYRFNGSELSGIDGLREVKRVLSDVPVVMLTSFDEEDLIYEALCAGASGYLLKGRELDELFETLRQASHGGVHLAAPVAEKVLSFFHGQPPKQEILTPREQHVLELMADGCSQQEISDHLHISKHTVGNHLRGIYRKLHVNTALEAVAKAYQEGWVRQAFRRIRGR
jgi:DNA-binding NarL/FixJ family response regulator